MIERVYIFKAGYCTHPEFITLKGGSLCNCEFPAICVLIKHKTMGYILFDTGYTHNFFEASQEFPLNLYPLITPVHFNPKDSILSQLQDLDIEANQIKYIIISHFHGDHISGLSDFPQAQYIYLDIAYNSLKYFNGFKALRAGFLPKLIPFNFEERSIKLQKQNFQNINKEFSPFDEGIDLFDDNSLIVVELGGHALGQIGLFLNTKNQGIIFLVADACWSSKAFKELIMPHSITHILFDNSDEYKKTLYKIHSLHQKQSHIHILPSHCQTTFNEFVQMK